jgi:hypothetical protein
VDDHIATLTLAASGRFLSKDPLGGLLGARYTNRRFYRKKPVPATLIDTLKKAVLDFPGVNLHLITRKKDLHTLAKLVYAVDRIRTEYRPLHEHLCKMIRFTDEDAMVKRDGLPIKNIEAGLAGELFLKATRPWPVMSMANKIGLGRLVALHAMTGIRRSSGSALLTVDGVRALDFLTGGRVLERLWLTLNKYGLCMQPMTAITLFRMRWLLEGKDAFSNLHQKVLEDVWKDFQTLFPDADLDMHGQIMLFRFGYGPEIKYGTYRKPFEKFMLR